MSIFSNQSDIGEVRDQLSLDYADGKYLNRVSANLGIQRPPFGFDDATWRALTKVVALQHKQIKTKFEEILSIILGPRVTQCGAFLENTAIGDTSALLVNSLQFPQVGTMVIDEGLATEETVDYVYIDRYTHRVYFKTPLVNAHSAVSAEWETGIISDVATTATDISVFNANGFPAGAYTICVGRGTAYEQAGPIGSVTLDSRYVSTGFPLNLGATGFTTSKGSVLNLSALATQENTYYLTLVDTSSLSVVDGHLQVQIDNAFTATGGSPTSVTVVGPLTLDVYGGYWVRFTGNITAALTNKLGYVFGNNATTLNFANTLPAAPAAGDNFVLLANFQYIRTLTDDAVLMRKEFPDLHTLAASAEVYSIEPTTTVAIAQVQVKGVDWDVFQVDPRNVEILLPVDFLANDLRSASFIRDVSQSGTSTADAVRVIANTDASVGSTSNMPLIGVLNHAASGNRYAYYNPHCWLTEDAAAGAVTITVTDTSQYLSTGTLNINGNTVLYTVVDSTTFSVAPLPAAVRQGDLVRDEKILRFSKGLLANIGIGETLDTYSSYSSGDIWSVDDVWPGPYVWDLFEPVHAQETVIKNTPTTHLSGPTLLSVDRDLTATVLEVDDASCFPTAVPFNVVVGENSGNLETLAVQELSLRSRTHTTVATAVVPGDLFVEVAALNGPVAPLHTFPNGGPYRVVLDPFTVDQEVVEVTSTALAPNRLLLSTAALNAHAIGAVVVLLSDLLRISPATADEHVGKISAVDKFGLYAKESQVTTADTVRPVYTSVTLNLAGTDFPVENGEAVFNFGHRLTTLRSSLVSVVGSVLTLSSTAQFPTGSYPYTIYVDVGAGPLLEEVLHVTNNNPGLNELTVSHPPVFTHTAGRAVEFRPGPQENFSYTSRTGSVLSFSSRLEIEHTHQEAEYLAPTVGTGYPRQNGFDFPLRLPVTIEDRIRYMTDLVRAAGVEVTFISKR